ncbi:hypothetical protein FOMPIDRAFT_58748, partial [Fomitopsis schrenkii]
ALYVYDYLLTLDREIKYFWKSKQSFGTILFYFYRYPALANTVLEVLSRMRASWQTAGVSHTSSSTLRFYSIYSTEVIFAAVRVYAIFHRKLWVFCVVLVTGLANPIILFYLFTRSVPSIGTVEGFSSCTLALAGGIESYETTAVTGMIAARVAGLIADTCVLVLTGIKTRQAGKSTGSDSQDSMSGLEQSLKAILLQDSEFRFLSSDCMLTP